MNDKKNGAGLTLALKKGKGGGQMAGNETIQ